MERDLFAEILAALQEGDIQAIARIYVETLRGLHRWEQDYLALKLQHLDFESRQALDKQELKLIAENEGMREYHERIATLKAVLRACSFVMDALKVANR